MSENHSRHPHQPDKPHLKATLILGCLAQFMIVLDISVVNVALPSIKHALGFDEAGLQWVINAYTIAFAGFLLLGGRAADLLGRRRVFVWGLVVFSLASLAGGLATSGTILICARVIGGLGGAVVSPASLSLLTTTFTKTSERNRAIGLWSATGGGGAAAGVLLGGVITQLLGWRWILFVNVPIGLVAAIAAQRLLIESRNRSAARNFDVVGAISATVGSSLLVFGVVRTTNSGWGDAVTLATIGVGLLVLALFLLIEGRLASAPLMPLRIFRTRQLCVGNVTVAVIAASTFPMWFFMTLYMQEVLGMSPLLTGLGFLPAAVLIPIAAPFASRLVTRLGSKVLLVASLGSLTCGLILFTRISADGSFWTDVLPPSIITCLSMPIAFVPGMICATTGVPEADAGIASGVVSTSDLMGGALGLAALTTLAASHSKSLLSDPSSGVHTATQALVSGFQLGFWIAAGIAFVGMLVALFTMKNTKPTSIEEATPIIAVEV